MDWMLCRMGGSSLAGGRAERNAGEVPLRAAQGAMALHIAVGDAVGCPQGAGLPTVRNREKLPQNIPNGCGRGWEQCVPLPGTWAMLGSAVPAQLCSPGSGQG